MDPTKCSNPTRITNMEDIINLLKGQGVEEVYVEVIDPDNICFTSVEDMKVYAICYSKQLER